MSRIINDIVANSISASQYQKIPAEDKNKATPILGGLLYDPLDNLVYFSDGITWMPLTKAIEDQITMDISDGVNNIGTMEVSLKMVDKVAVMSWAGANLTVSTPVSSLVLGSLTQIPAVFIPKYTPPGQGHYLPTMYDIGGSTGPAYITIDSSGVIQLSLFTTTPAQFIGNVIIRATSFSWLAL